MRMEIGTEDRNLNASMSGTSGWNETMDFGHLEGRDRWRGVEIEEHSRLRLGFLHNSYSIGNLWGSCWIRWAGDRGNSLRELEGIQGLVQSLTEIRHGDFRLSINSRDKVCRGGEGIEGKLW